MNPVFVSFSKQFELWAILILSGTLCLALAISAQNISASAFLTITGSTFFCSVLGGAVMEVAGLLLPPAARFPARILVGFTLISSLMLLLCLLLKISAGSAFLITCIPCLALLRFSTLRRTSFKGEADIPLLAILACLPSLIWSWQAIRSVPRMRTNGIFTAWVDFFYHTNMIVQFAKGGGTDVFEAESKIPLYHYASYMFSALVSNFSNTSAIVISTAHWCLFGFILMGLGAWALGAVLADYIGAWLALVFLLLLPNAAHYGMKNAFLDFHWLLQISAGLSYGLGLCLLVLALCVIAVRRKSTAALYFALTLTVLEALFKIQLFALLLPVCCITLLLLWSGRPAVKVGIGASLLTAALLGSLLVERIERAPHFWSAVHPVRQILILILDGQQSAIFHPFSRATAAFPSYFTVPIGLMILLAAAFGMLLPACLLGLYYCRRRQLSHADHFIPLIVVLTYCFIVVAFPVSTFNGSIEEYQHRNFVLVYAVLAVWCSVFLIQITGQWLSCWNMRVLALILTTALFPVPLLFSSDAQTGSMDWTRNNARVHVPTGFQKVAEYIRQNGKPLESIFVDDGMNEDEMIALSEHHAVLALVRGVNYSKSVLTRRQAISSQLQQAKTYDELTEVARSRGINWYIAAPGIALSGEITGRATIDAVGYRAFHLGNLVH